MKLYIPVSPMAFVRMTRKGKYMNKYAKRYIDYKTEVGFWLRKQCSFPISGAVKVSATFHMPIPASWSQKKKLNMAGRPVTVTPDIDNLIKALFDSANGILWPDDNAVCELMSVRKIYHEVPGIEMEVVENEPTG